MDKEPEYKYKKLLLYYMSNILFYFSKLMSNILERRFCLPNKYGIPSANLSVTHHQEIFVPAYQTYLDGMVHFQHHHLPACKI